MHKITFFLSFTPITTTPIQKKPTKNINTIVSLHLSFHSLSSSPPHAFLHSFFFFRSTQIPCSFFLGFRSTPPILEHTYHINTTHAIPSSSLLNSYLAMMSLNITHHSILPISISPIPSQTQKKQNMLRLPLSFFLFLPSPHIYTTIDMTDITTDFKKNGGAAQAQSIFPFPNLERRDATVPRIQYHEGNKWGR